SATGSDQHAFVIILALNEVSKHLFILSGGDIRQLFAASGANHKEHIQYTGSKSVRPGDDLRQFRIVHRLSAEMHLELKAVPLAGFNAGDRRFPGPRYAAKGVVLGGLQRINADAHAHHTDLDKSLGQLVIDQHPVCPEDDHKAEFDRITSDVENVGTHERFAARNDEETALIHLRNLLDEPV